MSRNADFFNVPSSNSLVKQQIVFRSFKLWLNDIRKEKQLSYIDLFSGPGIYDDNNISTPIYILQEICKTQDLAKKFSIILNDKNHLFMAKLRDETAKIENAKFLNTITTSCLNVDGNIFEKLPNILKEHCFVFLDPWGWKGLYRNHIRNLLRNQNCEIVLLLNLNQINRFLKNNNQSWLFYDLFNRKTLNRIYKHQDRNKLNEKFLLDEFIKNITDGIENCHVIPFRFCMEKSKQISHYLIFIIRNDNRAKQLEIALKEFSSCKMQNLCYSRRCLLTDCFCKNYGTKI